MVSLGKPFNMHFPNFNQIGENKKIKFTRKLQRNLVQFEKYIHYNFFVNCDDYGFYEWSFHVKIVLKILFLEPSLILEQCFLSIVLWHFRQAIRLES